MDTDTLTPAVVDPGATERAALAAELADLAGEVALYERARETVQQRIAAIEKQDLRPIDEALRDLRKREATGKAALMLLDYRALGPNEEARGFAFQHVQQAAIGAKNAALNGPGGALISKVIHHVWNRTALAWQASSLKLTEFGSTYTHEQRSADHLQVFRAVRVELERLAALPVEERCEYTPFAP